MELRDIYNSKGYKTGRIKKRSERLNSDEYYLAAEVWIINSKNEILIQKRSKKKEILPNTWGLTTGCMITGEDTVDGAIREVREELGVEIKKDELNLIRRILINNAIWDIYFVYKDIDLSELILQTEEVSDVKQVSIEELNKMLSNGQIFEYPEIYDILSRIKL